MRRFHVELAETLPIDVIDHVLAHVGQHHLLGAKIGSPRAQGLEVEMKFRFGCKGKALDDEQVGVTRDLQ